MLYDGKYVCLMCGSGVFILLYQVAPYLKLSKVRSKYCLRYFPSMLTMSLTRVARGGCYHLFTIRIICGATVGLVSHLGKYLGSLFDFLQVT